MQEHNDRDRFDEALRSWAQRPPRLGAEAAAARVRARLGARRSRRMWRPLAAAAAAVLMVVVALTLSFRSPRGEQRLADRPAASLDVAVLWLDADTPLYMNLKPLDIEKGDPS